MASASAVPTRARELPAHSAIRVVECMSSSLFEVMSHRVRTCSIMCCREHELNSHREQGARVALTVSLLVRQLRCDFHDTSAEPSKTKAGRCEAMTEANGPR